MNPVGIEHPSAEALQALALGRLDENDLGTVVDHLEACPTCRRAADEAPADAFVSLLKAAENPEASLGQNTHLDAPAADPALAATLAPEEARAVDAPDLPQALRDHPRYRPIRRLGEGGMGTVWLAEHKVMGRQVALKVVHPRFLAQKGAAERFRREVQAAARLHHPNIVTAHDAEQAGDTHFLVMEYVPGESLADYLKDRGPLPASEACEYVRQAALGLQHAHEQGMVHRDVKPHNLMRTPEGRIKVLDFGLARFAREAGPGGDAGDGQITGPNTVMGTADYLAPEQASDARKADTRADLYALGCTLFQLLTGRVPFAGGSVTDKLVKHAVEAPPRLADLRPDLPPGLAALVARLLAKRPADRPATPAALAELLSPFCHPEGVADAATAVLPRGADRRPRSRKQKPQAPPRRRWLVAAALALFGLVTVAGVVTYRIQTDEGELVIVTQSDDVKVVVEQGGKVVDIIDTKTNNRLTLKSGQYELKLKGAKEGLKLDLEKATLTRGQEVLAKVERVGRGEQPARPFVAAPGAVQRIPWDSVRFLSTCISHDDQYLMASGMTVNGYRTAIWNSDGQKITEIGGYCSFFLPDSHDFLVASDKHNSRIIQYDLMAKAQRRAWDCDRDVWGITERAISPHGQWLCILLQGDVISAKNLVTDRDSPYVTTLQQSLGMSPTPNENIGIFH